MDLKKLASRRFILAMTIVTLSSIMVGADLIEPNNYEALMIWISGIYIIGKPFGDKISTILERKDV